MNIYLLGHTGYIGSHIHRHFSERGYDLRTIKPDVTDLAQVREALRDVTNFVVINATGKTGKPNVDWCEDHRLETAKVNITGAINVAEVATRQGNYVVQIGSGCIFQHPDSSKFQVPSSKFQTNSNAPNSKPQRDELYAFTEDDEPNFFGSFYSQTKAIAESALKEIPNVCILRIRMPLQGSPHPKNLLDKLLQYDKIVSVPNSVTVIEDFLPFLERVIEKRVTGVLNAVNPGVYEHRDLLEWYRKIVDPNRHFTYIGLEEFQGMTKAPRSNCVLSTVLSSMLGIAMPPISESLQKVVESYGEGVA